MLTRSDIPAEEFPTAARFLRALSDARRWASKGVWNSPWVFRGQRNASWTLAPSAWRAPTTPSLQRLSAIKIRLRALHSHDVRKRLPDLAIRPDQSRLEQTLEAYLQGRAEFELVLEFVDMADSLGHPVPGMARYIALRDYTWIPDLKKESFVIEPNPATTLAQHHGIPTRFLDWSRSSATAAFFAASEVKSPTEDGSIAVWAIRTDLLMQHGPSSNDKERFMSYEAPRSENAYLRAQDGLFTYPAAGCRHYATFGNWPMLESFATSVEQGAKTSVIRKLTLPKTEVGELVRLLWLAGISRAHLMPTYDNITFALQTKWQWHP